MAAFSGCARQGTECRVVDHDHHRHGTGRRTPSRVIRIRDTARCVTRTSCNV